MNEIKLTENRSINEKFYTLHHASGLDIYVIPKKHSTAFAVFGTRYGAAAKIMLISPLAAIAARIAAAASSAAALPISSRV